MSAESNVATKLPLCRSAQTLKAEESNGADRQSGSFAATSKARGVIGLALLGFVLGGLLVVLNSDWRNDFLAPGPLISSHAQILGGLEGDRCAACHEAGSQSVADWFASLAPGQAVGAAEACQSDLCLKCHDRSLGKEHARFAHNVAPSLLEQATRQSTNENLRPGEIPVRLASHSAGAELACSVCHREHQGNGVSLSALTDAQCQTCHVRRFQSLGSGHPDFALAVPSGPTALAFDHASHGLKHFGAANRAFDCQSCHPPDVSGNVRMTAGFELACASCHAGAIDSSQRSGLELLALPLLDWGALTSAGVAPRDWPPAARGGFDGRLPPLMRLLLAGDPEAEGLIRGLPGGFEFADLDPAAPADVATGGKLAGAIVRLLDELAVDGGKAVARRLSFATGLPNDASLQQLLEQTGLNLPAESFRQWTGDWVPPTGAPDQTSKLDTSGLAPLFRRGLQDDGLLAENPARKLLAVDGGGTAGGQPAVEAFTDRPQRLDQAAQQATSATSSSPSPLPVETTSDGGVTLPPAKHTGELLATNPLAGQLAAGGGPTQAQPASPAHQPNTGLAEDLASRRSPRNASHPQAAHQPDQLPAARPFSLGSGSSEGSGSISPSPRSEWVPDPFSSLSSSGWRVDHQSLSLSRQPAGHADVLTRAWLEWLTRMPARSGESSHLSLFRDQLTTVASPGQCALCHQPQLDLASGAVLWTGPLRDPAIRSFTRFDHGPHAIVADCQSCHPLLRSGPADWPRVPARLTAWPPPNATRSASFVNASGLQPAALHNCTSCHRPGGTPDGCTTCHNYHLGPPSAAAGGEGSSQPVLRAPLASGSPVNAKN